MTLIKIYEIGDGTVIGKYHTMSIPRQNETIYLGEEMGIVKEVAHVVSPLGADREYLLQWIEVGIEFI